jgi:S-DNA-T family DNA segregation ATPase FtsK/SpoIIIE
MRDLGTAVWLESLRWLRTSLLLTGRYPGHAAVLLASAWLAMPFLSTPIAATAALIVPGCLFWSAGHPVSFQRVLVWPIVTTWRRLWFRHHWTEIADACGLTRERRRATRPGSPPELDVQVPRVTQVRAEGQRVLLAARPLLGQTLEDFETAAERLRTATGASRLRVAAHRSDRVLLTFTLGDSLAEPFSAG